MCMERFQGTTPARALHGGAGKSNPFSTGNLTRGSTLGSRPIEMRTNDPLLWSRELPVRRVTIHLTYWLITCRVPLIEEPRARSARSSVRYRYARIYPRVFRVLCV